MSRLDIRDKFIYLGLVLFSSLTPGQTGAGPHANGNSVPAGSVETNNQNNNESELPACCQEKIEYFKSRADKPASPEERAIITQVTDFMQSHEISDEELKRALHDVFGETAPKLDRPVTDFSEKIRSYTQGQNPGNTVSPIGGVGTNTGAVTQSNKGPGGSGTALGGGSPANLNLGGAAGQGLTTGSNATAGLHPGIGISPSGEGASNAVPIISGTKPNAASNPNSNGDTVIPTVPPTLPTVAINPSLKPVTPPVFPTPDNLNISSNSPTPLSPVVKPPTPPNTPPTNSVSQPRAIENFPPTTFSLNRDRSSNAPDFSFALTQNFQFNRPNPNPNPEAKNEIIPISPSPIPDFYATAPKISTAPVDTAPAILNPITTTTAPEGTKKSESMPTVFTTGELKLAKANALEITKPNVTLEPLSLTKTQGSISSLSMAAMPTITPNNSIPTLVLPLLSDKMKESQWQTPTAVLSGDLPNNRGSTSAPGISALSGSASNPNNSGTTAITNSTSKGNQVPTSSTSGIFAEIKAILNRSKIQNDSPTGEHGTPVESHEAIRQLSSVALANPVKIPEPSLWKVVFLEKSGKQLSMVNVMIAFGSTLLLIWILLMRLRRESKAAGAAQSVLPPTKDSAANRPDFNAP